MVMHSSLQDSTGDYIVRLYLYFLSNTVCLAIQAMTLGNSQEPGNN